MFSSLREKLLNVQEEITSSLRNLKLDRHGLRRTTTPRIRGPSGGGDGEQKINYEAGIELLERYQKYWIDIHKKTETTALAAMETDTLISKLNKTYEDEWNKIGQLNIALAHIPKVLHGVREISDRILNLQCAFDETEEALLNLENMIETQELREKELDHRFQLALYQEKRTREMEDLKIQLTEEHLVKLSEFEKKKWPQMKERQEAFEEAFQEDLQNYKQGHLSTTTLRVIGSNSSTAVSTPTLDEIELDEDPFVLEEFLAHDAENCIQTIGATTDGKESIPNTTSTTATTTTTTALTCLNNITTEDEEEEEEQGVTG